MTGIALFHLVWLLMLPEGAILLIVVMVSPPRTASRLGRVGLSAVGLLLLLLSLPAVLFCRKMWPVDFLVPGIETRVPVTGRGYTVSMVQKAGVDFYDSYLEIRRSDGAVTRLMVDCDADKWWGLRAESRGTRTDFVRGSGDVVAAVDFSDGTLLGSIDRERYNLDDLSFDRDWANGG